jgi:hypothetical protein
MQTNPSANPPYADSTLPHLSSPAFPAQAARLPPALSPNDPMAFAAMDGTPAGGSSVRSGGRVPRVPMRSDTLRSDGYAVDSEPRIFPGVVSRQRTSSVKAQGQSSFDEGKNEGEN